MRDTLKSLGGAIIGVAFVAGLILLVGLFIEGGARFAARMFPWFPWIYGTTLVIVGMIFWPLAGFRSTKAFAGLGIWLSSFVFGFVLFFWSLLLAYVLWGGIAVFIGLFIMGVGIVPVALLATMFEGLWGTTGQLVFLTVLTFGLRVYGSYLMMRAEELAAEPQVSNASETPGAPRVSKIPEPPIVAEGSQEHGWYVSRRGKRAGPLTEGQISRFIEAGKLRPDDLVWRNGLLKWTPVSDVPGLLSPPPLPPQTEHSTEREPIASLESIPAKSSSVTKEAIATHSTVKRPAPADRTDQEGKQRSYIARHWTGDLSLGISYWVNGTLVSLLVAVSTIILVAVDVAESPKLYSAGVIGAWTLMFIVAIWQLVGIWRSASNHESRGGKRGWAIVAQIMVVIGLLGTANNAANQAGPQVSEYWKILSGQDVYSKYQIRVLRNASELEILGPIGFGLTDDVAKTLDAHPTITLIHLNSIGGRIAEARKLRDLIESRQLSTYSSTGCFSGCVIAYMAGEQRLIAPSANLGFHQYAFPGVNPDAFAAEHAIDERYLISRGVAAAFVEKAFSTPNSQLWKPTHEELLEAHVITGYPGSDQVALSGLKPAEADRIEADLLTMPLYSALKAYEPQIYQQIVEEVKSGFQRGTSMTELRARTLPLIEEVYRRRLPYASDDALRAFIEVLLDQIGVLYAEDPVLCYEYLFPEAGKPLDVTRYFSQELLEQELSVMAAVIKSAATSARQPPTEQQVQRQLTQAWTRLSTEFGEDVALLEEPEVPAINKKRVCEITYALYSDINSLADHEAMPLLRYMFAN